MIYIDKNGIRVPGVTTIINKEMKLILKYWLISIFLLKPPHPFFDKFFDEIKEIEDE